VCAVTSDDCYECLPPGNAAAAGGLREIPSILAISNTGFPVSTLVPVSVADEQIPCLKDTVQALRQDTGGGHGGSGGGGGGGGGHSFACNSSCS
jgi:hypothetical protein